jgi:endonuclease/exonuclease/phosphatase (EEP) superfamily protein YafD
VLISACSPLSQLQGSLGEANHIAQSSSEVAECRELLSYSPDQNVLSLDSSNIQLMNWNIQKGKQLGWESDLRALGSDSQLVLMQEASLKPEMISTERLASYWSFAPGYTKDTVTTGVLTLSSIEPLTHCNLTDWEPWLRTPKATGITEYALTGTDQTLVVVNIHAINFTLGVKPYRRQLARITEALRDHQGPLILSGDFNSWRNDREKLLQAMVDELRLSTLDYGDDHRIEVFGHRIDHVYVRGLEALSTTSTAVTSSDHNPINVSLGLIPDQG